MKALIIKNTGLVIDTSSEEFEVHEALIWMDCEVSCEIGWKLVEGVLTEPEVIIDNVNTLRRFDYPEIGDQLDALFHAGVFPAEMAAEIQAVKDKYPK